MNLNPQLPGTTKATDEPTLPQPAKPPTAVDELWQFWEQMRAEKRSDILRSYADPRHPMVSKRLQQLANLDTLLTVALASLQPQG